MEMKFKNRNTIKTIEPNERFRSNKSIEISCDNYGRYISGTYHGVECMGNPIIVKRDDCENIKKYIAAMMRDFAYRYFEIEKEIKLIRIKPMLEDLSENEAYELLRKNKTGGGLYIICGDRYHDANSAIEAINRIYANLILTFSYE